MEDDPKNYAPERPGSLFYVGWIGLVIVVLAATAGLVLARELWIGHQTAQLEQRIAEGPRVLVTRVIHAPPSRSIALPGTISGYIETSVYAKIPGYLKTIFVDKGDRVKKGQVLAILESPEIDQQVVNARAAYHLALITDQRDSALMQSQVIAKQDFDQSHAAMLQAKATLDQLIAEQQYKIIRAPFDGVVTARYVDPGALIPQVTTPSTGSVPIVAMATLNPVRVYVYVPQSVSPFIRDGDPATVTVAEYAQRPFTGTITRHPEALMAASRTMLVEIDLPNRDRALYPGMYATVKFKVAVPNTVPQVPDDALIFRDGNVYVPVVRNDHLRLAQVTLGYDDGLTVEVTKGIANDDLVAINVGQSARDGEPVRVTMADSRTN
ncbi:MAG: efflux RND transporter periplasmic adaptor subunit [Candidatus Binataceae bacterium]